MKERFQYGRDYTVYDMDLIEMMYNIRICGVPLSFYLLDLRKTDTYCHLTSDILAYFIEGSNRVEGEMPCIKGDDKGHSWVEKDDLVYETTKGAIWKKKSFYERYSPYNCVVQTRDSSEDRIKKYLNHSDNYPELYMAWIQDMEECLDTMVYGKVLRMHMDRFKEEKGLDGKSLNPELIKQFYEDLQKAHKHTEEFKAGVPKKS